jgi:hypothetical protein
MTNFASQSIRRWLAFFIVGLVLSGLTAFPLEGELGLLKSLVHALPLPAALVAWVDRVEEGVRLTNAGYPFLAYGTDWLAFAHLCIAVAFVGPWRDPVRNRWIIDWGLICCAGIIPLALIAGAIRGIPWFWQLVDCSFALGGGVPLWIVRRKIDRLEGETAAKQYP